MSVHLIRKPEEHLRRQDLLQEVVDAGALDEVRDVNLGAQEVGEVGGGVLGVLVDLLHQVMPCIRLLFLELAEGHVGRVSHVAAGHVALAEVVEVRHRPPDVAFTPLLLVARDHLVPGQSRVLLHRRILAVDDAERGPDEGRRAALRDRSREGCRRRRLALIAVAGVENNFT